jgi:hypothetical protein
MDDAAHVPDQMPRLALAKEGLEITLQLPTTIPFCVRDHRRDGAGRAAACQASARRGAWPAGPGSAPATTRVRRPEVQRIRHPRPQGAEKGSPAGPAEAAAIKTKRRFMVKFEGPRPRLGRRKILVAIARKLVLGHAARHRQEGALPGQQGGF